MNSTVKVIRVGILILLFAINLGCTTKELSCKSISLKMFDNIINIHLLENEGDIPRQLSNEEIEYLKSSIRDGSELYSVISDDFPLFNKDSKLFMVKDKDAYGYNVIYKPDSKYLYIRKVSIFHREMDKNLTDLKWLKTHVEGYFMIKTSEAINNIFKK